MATQLTQHIRTRVLYHKAVLDPLHPLMEMDVKSGFGPSPLGRHLEVHLAEVRLGTQYVIDRDHLRDSDVSQDYIPKHVTDLFANVVYGEIEQELRQLASLILRSHHPMRSEIEQSLHRLFGLCRA